MSFVFLFCNYYIYVVLIVDNVYIDEIPHPTCTSQSAPLLAGIIPTFVLLLVNIITVVVAVLITRHCYKKTSQKSSPSKGEDVYDQVEGPKTYEDIVMTDSPAYGPVK